MCSVYKHLYLWTVTNLKQEFITDVVFWEYTELIVLSLCEG